MAGRNGDDGKWLPLHPRHVSHRLGAVTDRLSLISRLFACSGGGFACGSGGFLRGDRLLARLGLLRGCLEWSHGVPVMRVTVVPA